MEPIDIYHEALRLGLTLEAVAGWLEVSPKGTCPPDFAEVLREHKHSLLTWLSTHHRRGWGEVPPDDLPLNPATPRPAPMDIEAIMGFAKRQSHPRMQSWLEKRESEYLEGPGQFWTCDRRSYAAARDLAVWQLNTSESEAVALIGGFAETAQTMSEDLPER
jgi:hypothetical protein